MSVGGRLFSIDRSNPAKTKLCVRDEPYGDITCVYADTTEHCPKLGETVWWHSPWVLCEPNDTKIPKIGYSFSGKTKAATGKGE